jgi:hypothetical protein
MGNDFVRQWLTPAPTEVELRRQMRATRYQFHHLMAKNKQLGKPHIARAYRLKVQQVDEMERRMDEAVATQSLLGLTDNFNLWLEETNVELQRLQSYSYEHESTKTKYEITKELIDDDASTPLYDPEVEEEQIRLALAEDLPTLMGSGSTEKTAISSQEQRYTRL